MYYSEFKGLKLPHLGFGTMRLPLNEDKTINVQAVEDMTDYAMENGVNYFDTAYPYHGGMSEIAISRALARYPRDSYYLADKYPGHQIAETYDPEKIFEDQLRKCNTEYFDFYLLHNVYEKSVNVYTDPKWGIIPYFLEQRRKGRIKHLGFSSHASPEALRAFLAVYGKYMEFCQIQLNYVDWNLQNAAEKYNILKQAGIPVWVMEPLRGGRLAGLSAEEMKPLSDVCKWRSPVEWAFHWLMSLSDVKVILSGMSDLHQMVDNVRIFSADTAEMSETEREALMLFSKSIINGVPCTGCGYCAEECPNNMEIPYVIRLYNDIKFTSPEKAMNAGMLLKALPESSALERCVACGVCMHVCPQKIEIPRIIAELKNDISPKLPDWEKICKERAEAARRLAEGDGK